MVTSKTVQVRDIEMAYWDIGEGDRTFVLVHGYTGSKLDFVSHLDALGNLGRTLLIDQRGHGETSNPGSADEYSYQGLGADLDAFLDAMELDQVDLLGHSLGGMMAMRYTLAHPERVASLILMDTGPDPMPAQLDRAARTRMVAGGMADLLKLRQQTADTMERAASVVALEERIGSDAYWQLIETKLLSMDPVAFIELGQLLNEAPSVMDELSAIACPTTVIVGEEDTPFVTASDKMVAAITSAELVLIPKAAHSPQNENPGPWIEAVTSHIKNAR